MVYIKYLAERACHQLASSFYQAPLKVAHTALSACYTLVKHLDASLSQAINSARYIMTTSLCIEEARDKSLFIYIHI